MDSRHGYDATEMWHSSPKKPSRIYRRDGDFDTDSNCNNQQNSQVLGSGPYHHYSHHHVKHEHSQNPSRYANFALQGHVHSPGTHASSGPQGHARSGNSSLRRSLGSPGACRKIQFLNKSPNTETSFIQRPWLKTKTARDRGSIDYPRRTTSSVQLRYKTELCTSFEETGICPFGGDCTFAHGFVELRAVSHHPKYKTNLCHSFYTFGYCVYGSRCHFVHKLGEIGGMSSTREYLIQKRRKELLNDEFLESLRQLYNVQQSPGAVGGVIPDSRHPAPLHLDMIPPVLHPMNFQIDQNPALAKSTQSATVLMQQLSLMNLHLPGRPQAHNPNHSTGSTEGSGSLNLTSDASITQNPHSNLDMSMNKASETSAWGSVSDWSTPSKDSVHSPPKSDNSLYLFGSPQNHSYDMERKAEMVFGSPQNHLEGMERKGEMVFGSPQNHSNDMERDCDLAYSLSAAVAESAMDKSEELLCMPDI